MSGPNRRMQRQHAGARAATTNGSRDGAATGTQAILQQDTAHSSNSETGMTSTCSRGRIQTEYNRVIEISTNYVKMSTIFNSKHNMTTINLIIT